MRTRAAPPPSTRSPPPRASSSTDRAMWTRSGKVIPPRRGNSSSDDLPTSGHHAGGPRLSPRIVAIRKVPMSKVAQASTWICSPEGGAHVAKSKKRAPLFPSPSEHFLSTFSAHRICHNLPFTEEMQTWIKLSRHGALFIWQ